ncbi:MAG: TOBE domain-containing protein [bacterium]|nr:TOBE domain-containing protein [bacterium]
MSDRVAVFNNGKCLQYGTPQEIYSNPVNSFVAKFIGDTNFFKLKVRNGSALIDEKLPVDSLNKTGQYLSIRPQDIEIAKSNENLPNTFKGVITDIQMNGMFIDYNVKVKDISFKVTVLNCSKVKTFTIKETVYISFNPDSMRAFN